MGPRTVRFTAEDFVIPPEFGGLRLAKSSAGQIGGVHLTLNDSGGQTVFGPIFQQVPLRVLPPFQFPGEPALVYLMNPTAGLLDGDGHRVEINAGPGTRAMVTGQSATRIHPAVNGFSTQQWQVRAGEGSQLVLLPGPNIPYRGSRYHQEASIDLDDGAQLVWGDIWTPGRYARLGDLAEHYQFERIVQELEIHRRGVLVYRDRFTWEGPWDAGQAQWYLGGGLNDASGSLFMTGKVDLSPMGRNSSLRARSSRWRTATRSSAGAAPSPTLSPNLSEPPSRSRPAGPAGMTHHPGSSDQTISFRITGSRSSSARRMHRRGKRLIQ